MTDPDELKNRLYGSLSKPVTELRLQDRHPALSRLTRPVNALRNRLVDRVLWHGADTSKKHADLTHFHPDRALYVASGWRYLRRGLRRRDVGPDDVFVDFGAGKGRVVCQAARYPFARVIGVEISGPLVEVARANVARNRGRLACEHVELVHADVADFDIPDDVTFAYFFHPFAGGTFQGVIDRLVESVERRPRRLTIVYACPGLESCILSTGRFRLARTSRGGLRNFLSRRVSVYVHDPPPSIEGRVRQAQVTLLVDAQAARIVKALGARGIQTVLLKGPGIARWLYADDESRRYVDVDLLVHPKDVDAALATLYELGYEDRERNELERTAAPHARTLVRSGTRLLRGRTAAQVPVDLHTSFHGVEADGEVFWEALQPELETLRLGDVDVRIPGERARTLLLALHAADGGTAAAKPLRDLARGLAQLSDERWRGAFELARELRAEPALVAGLELDPAGRALIERCGFRSRGSTRTELHASGAPRMALGLERLASTRGWRQRARLLARELTPTPDFMRAVSPLARRGPIGLALSYALRPASLVVRLPRAAAAVASARRAASRRASP